MQKNIYFLTGASGVGKTTLGHLLEKKYENNSDWKVLYFDSIGVPSPEEMVEQYGSGSEWQRAMTHQWVKKLMSEYTESNIVLDGQINLDFIEEACQKHDISHYKTILIDCEVEVMCQRLSKERGQPELVNQDMKNWLQHLRNQAQEKGVSIIDTTHLSKEEVLKAFEKIALSSES